MIIESKYTFRLLVCVLVSPTIDTTSAPATGLGRISSAVINSESSWLLKLIKRNTNLAIPSISNAKEIFSKVVCCLTLESSFCAIDVDGERVISSLLVED